MEVYGAFGDGLAGVWVELDVEVADVEVADVALLEGAALGENEVERDAPIANACFIMKSSRSSVLARYNPFTERIKKVDKGTRNYGIQPRNAEQSFAFEVLNDPKH